MAQDIYGALRADHERVRELLDAVLESREDIDQRFAELQLEYTAHERAEERAFYEPLLRPTATREAVLEGFAEHHESDLVMRELASVPNVYEEHWHAQAETLKEMVEHHIDEEEREIFPAARQAMDEDWAVQARGRFEQAKTNLARTGRSVP